MKDGRISGYFDTRYMTSPGTIYPAIFAHSDAIKVIEIQELLKSICCMNMVGNVQQFFSSNAYPDRIPYLFRSFKVLGRFFGCHGNGCQHNQGLDIFQALWSKGPPSGQIS